MTNNRQAKARVREMAKDEDLCDVTLKSMGRYQVTAVTFSKHNPSVATDYSVIVQDSHSHKTVSLNLFYNKVTQGCHTLREFREFLSLRKSQGISIYFLYSGKF